MNKNNRSGGVKFRELEYSQSPAKNIQDKNNVLRCKEDILKLFAKPSLENDSSKENSVEALAEKSSQENVASVGKRPQMKPRIDIIREKPRLAVVQSNFVDSSAKALSPSSNKKIYNVMIGKISTRKHKQWDSDGLLEVTGTSAVLKDAKGKYIGRTTVKPETIEEGFRICMSGKEIEIVELASLDDIQARQGSGNQHDNDSYESVAPPPAKKARTTKAFVPVKSGSSLHFNYEPLVMPHPPLDFEWSQDRDEQKIHEVSVDGCLASVLRPHQREGVVFLYKCIMGMNDPKFKGAILADEMGLGKTLQCICLIWTLLKKGPTGKPVLKKVLIVTPSSLCGNWNKEFGRWLGSMKISPYVVESNKRKVKDFTKTPRACVMIVSYETLVKNIDDVKKVNFDLMICDEGHRLKNSEVKAIKLLSKLNCQRQILLTGTPLQNDLQEFYTLANFVNPGILGSFSEFKSYYEHPIVNSKRAAADEEEVAIGQARAQELHERSKTFILRRTNNLIDRYLPKKHELVVFCRLTREQENLYSLTTDYWFNRSLIGGCVTAPLIVVMALKKICNHPYLFTSEKNQILDEVLPNVPTNLSSINTSLAYSSKFKVVQSIFQELKSTQEKIVLISYFTQTLDLLEKICCSEQLQFCRLDGNTPAAARNKIVDRFNSKDNSCTRGVGLNLVGASRLILFDSDWNPANDAQAMARIWRDGQKRSVYIYRLLTTGTIEEKIYQRQINKMGLSDAVIDANYLSSLKLSASELKDLFTLDSQTLSVTHDLMECICNGSGDIPCNEVTESQQSNSEDSRDCQLALKKAQPQHQITINQLLSWQHFKQPVSLDLLKELMLQHVQQYVTFIFKNTVEK
ncbi:DNA repair and recombination protein RAD54B isoform X2 [Copidosoma floridanum]|uniref:DNA repair and recombination protein RAD54B isoform X2 n=1 Tax=Copidosoma floridanum TaxID=29053 RepID=UPI0006C98F7B|nr:DNA repair and recombination protein RAD54B isoform X2 [Copidosoma floridanum]